jgi:hypothetical protein
MEPDSYNLRTRDWMQSTTGPKINYELDDQINPALLGDPAILGVGITSLANTNTLISILDNSISTNATVKPIIEEKNMLTNDEKNAPLITKTFIFGQELSTMTEQQLINAIKATEANISHLESINIKSTKINSKIESLKQAIEFMVNHLDKI